MRGGDKEVVDDVVGTQLRTAHAFAAAALRPVQISPGALGIAAVGDRYDDVFLGDEILDRHVAVVGDDLGPPVVAVFRRDLAELSTDNLALTDRGRQDRLVVGDLFQQLLELINEFLALKGRQLAQLHVEDGSGLDLVDLQQIHQALPGSRRRFAAADQRDDFVDPVDRLDECANNVRSPTRLLQQVTRPPDDDVNLVRNPVPDHLVEPERPRHAVDQRHHVGAEGVLQLGVLVQVVEHDLGHGVALEHDNQPLAGSPAALVADLRDAADSAVLGQVRDLLREVIGVDLERQLGSNELDAAAPVLFDIDNRAHGDGTAASPVRLLDASPTDDLRGGREVWARNPLEQRDQQFIVGRVKVLEIPLRASRDLTQVVRRDLGRHADRDALRAVDEQIREPGRQHDGLTGPAVVVRPEVDRLLVDVPQHLHRQRREPALGVPVGGGRVVAG